MLTHQASLEESICEEIFPITYIKKVLLLPISLLAGSYQYNSLIILVNCKKCIFNISDTLTAAFLIYYYEIYSHSFIHSIATGKYKYDTYIPDSVGN